jgi:hypothetical protein
VEPLIYVVEPSGLLLLWQSADIGSTSRTKRVVGEVARTPSGHVTFEYLRDDADFQHAVGEGFQGFPAFSLRDSTKREGVVEALMRRLPPRRRADFPLYLQQHGLSGPAEFSDFALLGYTGARLPSDGFSIVPQFPLGLERCDYVAEVAGLRHVYRGDVSSIRTGSPVTFVPDLQNKFDADAVAIYLGSIQLGYVNRALRQSFNEWLRLRDVRGTVCRINGQPERPLVFVRVEVR